MLRAIGLWASVVPRLHQAVQNRKRRLVQPDAPRDRAVLALCNNRTFVFSTGRTHITFVIVWNKYGCNPAESRL